MSVCINCFWQKLGLQDGLNSSFYRVYFDNKPILNAKVYTCFFSDAFSFYDGVLTWERLPHYWPFVRGIHWSPVNSHHRGPKYCVAVIFSLLPTWQSYCTNSRFTGALRRLYPHVTLLWCYFSAACRWRFSPVWMDSLWLVICVAQVIYSNAWPLH